MDVGIVGDAGTVMRQMLAARGKRVDGGRFADPKREKPGRDLGYTRFDLFAQSLGCHGEQVEKPEDIRPALERAKNAIRGGKPALVNVVTDFAARAVTVRFTKTAT